MTASGSFMPMGMSQQQPPQYPQQPEVSLGQSLPEAMSRSAPPLIRSTSDAADDDVGVLTGRVEELRRILEESQVNLDGWGRWH